MDSVLFKAKYKGKFYEFSLSDVKNYIGDNLYEDSDYAAIYNDGENIYTGCKDKNNIKIYFNDKLRIYYSLTNVIDSKVMFKRGIFYVLDRNGKYHPLSEFLYDENDCSKQLEVLNEQ